MSLTAREIVTSGKQYLENNDLAGFYKYIYDMAGADSDEVYLVSEFLDKGCNIFVEQELEYVPECYSYIPDRWIKNDPAFGDIVVLPPTLYELRVLSFAGVHYSKKGIMGIDINNVENIGAYAFGSAGFYTLFIHKPLKKVHRQFLAYSGITKIFYDKDCDEDVIDRIKEIIERDHMPTEVMESK